MELEANVLIENLNSGREDLVSADELENFALSPGGSTSGGHGCSSSSTVEEV